MMKTDALYNARAHFPCVSVVTPSYNQAQFLEETILSVLDQDYPNIEYIVIDGGSTDGSADIIKKFERRLAYWISEPDRGQSHAINKGWQHARGDIVAYLNSDDLYTPGAITIAVQGLLSNPDSCMVYSDAVVIDERSNAIGAAKGHPFDVGRVMTTQVKIPQPTMFVRRSALDTVGLLDERLHLCMDFDLWIRLGLKYPATYLPGVSIAKMRAHTAAKSTAALAKFPQERRRVLNRVFAQSDLPASVKRVRKHAYSYMSFDQAAIAALVNQPQRILQPLLRSAMESPSYVASRPLDVAYLLARSFLPWWKGRSLPTAPKV